MPREPQAQRQSADVVGAAGGVQELDTQLENNVDYQDSELMAAELQTLLEEFKKENPEIIDTLSTLNLEVEEYVQQLAALAPQVVFSSNT